MTKGEALLYRGDIMKLQRFKLLLVALFLLPAQAISDEQIGDWYFKDSIEGIQIANTVNTSELAAGVLCALTTGTCSAYIATTTGCSEGGLYPMMINSAVGAFLISSKCTEISGDRFLVIQEFPETRAAFESGGEVGFVLPLESGQFRVMRFSTKGATAAINKAMTKPETSHIHTTDELL